MHAENNERNYHSIEAEGGGNRHQHKPQHPHRDADVKGRQGKVSNRCNRDDDDHGGRDQPGIDSGLSDNQCTDNGDRLADGLRQPDSGFTQNFKGDLHNKCFQKSRKRNPLTLAYQAD
ncbi:hypothetical protein D3C73_1151840 [compost metagenome]